MYTAIIGISCKFPGANDYAEYWENLATGKSSITEIPKKRWDWKACWGNPQKEKNKSQSKWGGFIRQVDAFDMNFFGLTPKVVQTMDPQQRIMLELAWACFEDAGIPPSSVKGSKIGVFLGVFNHDYKELQESGDLDIEAHHSTGTATAVIPNRVSHYFSLMGPSIPIDTACSGSLNAIHSAIQAIEYGDCEMALAGGINLLLTPTRHISFSKMGMLSPTGSCKTFDDSADGYVRGEGAGVLLLKPLEKALADRDSIHAVIKGSAVNHCGKTYTLTFPNPEAQADVIVSAHQRAGIPANTVGYIEAHGTGTPKGDPLEFKGLLSAFETLSGSAGAPLASQTAWCGLGSVKTNIGHLEAAAGVAGVIKIAMSLQHKQLPPLHNYSKLNSRITIEDTPFYIVDKLQEWRPSVEKAPLRAGVSSFGFGGTNSHVVLEEAPAVERVKGEQPAWYLICLSAKTEVALDRKRRDLLAWLEKDNGETDLLSISATLLLGRDHFDFRKAYVVKSLAELRENLNVETEIPENTFESSFLKAQPEAENEGAEGRRKAAERALALFASGKALSPGSCRKVMSILAKLYVLGEELYVLGEGLEWQPLFSRFGKGQIQRVHLPTYPFARDRCWIDGGGGNGKLRMENGEFFSRLHPLVHCNVSTLEEQCFSSTFSGDEFFLSDHKVGGRAVLPEVAILEMAREAVARATATLDGKQNSVCLRDVVWVKPVLVPTVVDSAVVNSAVVNSESPKAFYIGVYPENSSHNGSAAQSRNSVGFEVFSKTGADDITVYCQGGALVGDDVEPSAVLNRKDSAVLNKKDSAVLNKKDSVVLNRKDSADLNRKDSADLNRKDSAVLNKEDSAVLNKKDSAVLNKEVTSIDLSALKAEFQQNTDLNRCYSADQCYQAFSEMGLEYGEAFKNIEAICFHTDGDQCMAKLSLPAVTSENQDQFILHPGIVDAVVQASVALVTGLDVTASFPFAPVALEELNLVNKNNGTVGVSDLWVHVRLSEKNSETLDIDLFDGGLAGGNGGVIVQFKGLALRREAEKSQEGKEYKPDVPLANAPVNDSPAVGSILLYPTWKEQSVAPFTEGESTEGESYSRHVVMLLEFNEDFKDAVAAKISDHSGRIGAVECQMSNSKQDKIENCFQSQAVGVLSAVKNIIKQQIKDHPREKVLFQLVIPTQGEKHLLSGLVGILKTARKEYPKFVGQLMGVNESESAASIAEKLTENSRCPDDQHIEYVNGKRRVATWAELTGSAGILPTKSRQVSSAPTEKIWKDHGVYLITGGAGGLGLIFANEIARQVKAPRLILTGRRDASSIDETPFKSLRELGAIVEYRQMDVGKSSSVRSVIKSIQDEFSRENGSPLNGIIHSAGIILDNIILKKKTEELQQVLEPKVAGLINLDSATQELELDFLIVFASTSGALGNIGQADYAAANAFMDAFAHYRNELVKNNRRRGHTLAINWPLWKEGGMHVDAATEKMLRHQMGAIPLTTGTGIKALYEAMASGRDQVMVMEGELEKIRQNVLPGSAYSKGMSSPYEILSLSKAPTIASMLRPSADLPKAGALDTDNVDVKVLQPKLLAALKQTASVVLGIGIENVNTEAELNSFGFDSVLLVGFANQINEEYNTQLNAPVFFEHRTLVALTQYMLEEYPREMASHFGLEVKTAEAPMEAESVGILETVSSFVSKRERFRALSLVANQGERFYSGAAKGLFSATANGSFPITANGFSSTTADGSFPTTANGLSLKEEVIPSTSEYSPKANLLAPVPNKVEAQRGDSLQPSAFSLASPIAIIGISGRFPMADDVNELWRNLLEGKDCIREVPTSRWDWKAIYGDPTQEGNKTNIKWGGFVDGVDEFDPLFFSISPHEAELMDPNQRLLMTYVWKAIEDAGYSSESLSGSNTAIYVGIQSSDYASLVIPRVLEGYSITSQSSTVGPNRMSFFLNFHGPSEPIDTACSSSLVAVHRAVLAMRAGSCDAAIVGGVHTMLTQESYIARSKAGMLSEDGRCKTFSDQANGYIPGEGVGMLFLKKLSVAEKDGDHIYGLIRGSAENHGGRSNSLTAPNPVAQAELLKAAYSQAGVDPRQIGYIEAHGTGTKLGDPIEINGLKSAFHGLFEALDGFSRQGERYVPSPGQERVRERAAGRQGLTGRDLERAAVESGPYCGLGSIKTNIGHLELAAGVAGLIKILLQLKHKTLVPSIHCDTINPMINLSGSPFYVVRELKAWGAPKDDQGRELPRVAGVSSFGFGGANAHVVIEEYISRNKESKAEVTKSQLILLSARNEERLREQVKSLLECFETESFADGDLPGIAYTLQVGRDAMDERLGIVVGSVAELVEKLRAFVEGEQNIEGLYRGEAKRDKEAVSIFSTDEAALQLVDAWAGRGEFIKILGLWVKGLKFDWGRMYGKVRPGRVSLPGYPFVMRRYWIDTEKVSQESGKVESLARLHPLVHRNTSTLSEQRFSSAFSGDEFFLTDHVVNSQRVLPGVACLEMVRVAVEQAMEKETAAELAHRQLGLQLRNIVWARPLRVGERQEDIHIGLYPDESVLAVGSSVKGNHSPSLAEGSTQIAYEIYSEQSMSESGERETEVVVHGQGTAVLGTPVRVPELDLNALRAECSRLQLGARQCYTAFQKMGIDYGPAHQGIEELWVGEGRVLAKLRLPVSVREGADDYWLHPSLLDSALQAYIGLPLANGDDVVGNKPALPFALDELNILSPCCPSMWASLRYSKGSGPDKKVQHFDVDLCDDNGRVCAQFKGFTLRVLDNEVGAQAEAYGSMMLQPFWREQPISSGDLQDNLDNKQVWGEHRVILCEAKDSLREDIEAKLKGQSVSAQCLSLQCEQTDITVRYEDYVSRVFEQIQAVLRGKPKAPVLVQVVIPYRDAVNDETQLFAGLSGLLKTAQLENPKLIGQLIEVDTEINAVALVARLLENRSAETFEHVRYRDGKRWVAGWREVDGVSAQEENRANPPWKEDGVYVITGGVGGLGLLFAKDIAEHVEEARVVLVGRSELSDDKAEQLNALHRAGVVIEYRQTDITDSQAVSALIQGIEREFGAINGILHSAGVIRDNFILNKTRKEIHQVLAPKVSGLVNIDRATKDSGLDFLVVFSSTAGALGNVGQADYSAGNAFMDAYAGYRNQLVAAGERRGRTVSINWPLWKEGGMHVDAQTERVMKESMGMVAMQSDVGLRALYQAIVKGGDQWMVMEGELTRLRENLLGKISASDSIESDQLAVIEAFTSAEDLESLRDKTLYRIKNLFSDVVKLDTGKIDINEPLGSYGIDSIMITRLNRQLGEVFGDLSKTLFYEYQTLSELTEYFLSDYQQGCLKWTGLDTAAEFVQPTSVSASRVKDSLSTQALNQLNGFPSLISFKTKIPNRSINHSLVTSRFSVMETAPVAREPIAIIGISGRYPQANNLEEYWQNLVAGKECITEIPPERWPLDDFFVENQQTAIEQGKSYSKWGGFIDGFAEFDPLFFGISPRESLNMDPQERLFLQSCWHTFEDAGYTRERLAKQHQSRVGVFAGITKTGFDLYGPGLRQQGEQVNPRTSFGSVANRISYFMNLHGPSMPIDTMCSSSLTAIYEACESLIRGVCELAIAGGVNLYVHPSTYVVLCSFQMLSIDGQCKSFGQGGNGFVPGEGVGSVLLKSLSNAEKDGDHIYAVIRSSTINHGGKTNGYTIPNPKAQGQLIRDAMDKAGIDARAISYIEAHGTGTVLGDPIEVTGLTQAFQKDTVETQFCALGSVKSNIGHLEAAAGIAGLTKIILQMQHQQLVPSLHVQTLNPNINFEKTPFVVQQESSSWKRPKVERNGEIREYPRIAGISSFGAGGANAHIIVEEYLSPESSETQIYTNSRNPVLVVLSAKTNEQLTAYVQNLLGSIKNRSDVNVSEVAYTLQVGREAMEERIGLLVDSLDTLIERLQKYVNGEKSIDGLYSGKVKKYKEILNMFFSDKEFEVTIDKWIKQRKYDKLLELWVKGLEIDWRKLYGSKFPRCVSLPGYPFSEKSYWFSRVNDKILSSNSLNDKDNAYRNKIFYEQIIDNITSGELSVDTAVMKVETLIDTEISKFSY